MSTPEIEPTDRRARRGGRLLVGSGTTNVVFGIVIIALLMVVGSQSKAIVALSGGVNVLRAQVDTCSTKPANTAGCTKPAAAEPSVIVKQVAGSPGVPGVNGLNGAVGPAGQAGPPGPRGPAGPPGARGPAGLPGGSPACLLEPSRCAGSVGPAGPAGAKGADGSDGIDGRNGSDGADGADGVDGQDGAKGDKGDTGDPGCPPGNHLFQTNVLTKDQPVEGITSIECVPDIGP